MTSTAHLQRNKSSIGLGQNINLIENYSSVTLESVTPSKKKNLNQVNPFIDWHRHSNRLKSKTQIQSIKTKQKQKQQDSESKTVCFFLILNIQ